MNKILTEEDQLKIKKDKIIISKRKYRNSEKGHKEHRVWDWEFKNKIICDYDAIYDIVMNAMIVVVFVGFYVMFVILKMYWIANYVILFKKK